MVKLYIERNIEKTIVNSTFIDCTPSFWVSFVIRRVGILSCVTMVHEQHIYRSKNDRLGQ